MKHTIALTAFGTIVSVVQADDIVQKCAAYPFPDFACIQRYASALPLDFLRTVNLTLGYQETFVSTRVSNDTSFASAADATFLIWDEKLAGEILGENPSYEFMFAVSSAGHEAPVYVPDTNQLFFSQLERGWLPQLVVDLNNNPPTLSEKTASPPLYAAAGARYRDGLIYVAAGGGNASLDGQSFHPGIYTLNPKTMESKTVVNNYYGYYFNTADDLDIDAEGRIWFTDNLFSRNVQFNTEAPQLGAASYRYDPATGAVSIIDDTLEAPNGIAFSPDRKTLYMTDTGAGVPMIDPRVSWQQAPSLTWNNTNKRAVYAFDVSDDGTYLKNRRPVFLAMDFVPDGLKVASNGYLLTGSGHGVDVLDSTGRPLLRVQTNFTAVNCEFVGENRDELWIVGHGGVARVKWNLTGPVF